MERVRGAGAGSEVLSESSHHTGRSRVGRCLCAARTATGSEPCVIRG